MRVRKWREVVVEFSGKQLDKIAWRRGKGLQDG